MEAFKQNKYVMYNGVDSILNQTEYKPIWQNTPAFVELYDDFTAAREEIDELTPKQGKRKTGLAEDKEAARSAMCKTAYVIAGAVAAHAHKAANHELLTRVDTTLSILLGGRGKDSSDKCKDILAAATANLAALAGYDVKQEDLDKLDKLIQAYDELTPKLQAARASAKSAGQALDAVFDKADGILNNGLDKLMLKYEDSHPDFYRDYTNARIIIARSGGRGNGNGATAVTESSPSLAVKA